MKLYPYYWEYRGKPVLLLGRSIHSNLFQIDKNKNPRGKPSRLSSTFVSRKRGIFQSNSS